MILAIVFVARFPERSRNAFAAAGRQEARHRLCRHERAGVRRCGCRATAAFSPSMGLTLKRSSCAARRRLVAAMASNEIEVGYTGGTAVIGAVANGADLKVLSALTNRVTYDLVVKPGIKRPEDLRGKIFGIQSHRRHGVDGRDPRSGASEARAERDKIAIIAVGDQNVLGSSAGQAARSMRPCSTACRAGRLQALGFPISRGFEQGELPILSSSASSCGSRTFKRTRRWRRI